MASKLYPPILEASIPAFYGNTIVIPFKHNPLVSSKDYKDFAVQIKKINGDVVEGSPFIVSKEGLTDNQIVLNVNANFIQSNWYKIQIAYKNSIVGYYSTAAVAKYLGANRPTVSLRFVNGAYIGIYKHEDASEKAYSYQFILTDASGNVIEDTGEKIHNVNDDIEETSSSDIFYFKYNLKEEVNKYYSLEYILTTINGIVLKAKTQITKGILDGFDQDQLFNVTAKLNRDQGSVEIWARGLITPITGSFILRKVCSKDDYLRIQSVTCFDLTRQTMAEEKDGQLVPFSIKLCEDLTCEAGYYYKYYIQQYNKYSVFSKPVGESAVIYVSFDDCFLYDGEKQLRILYNPKISSFKENILQSKSETIGSKYPFITRNSIVGYKEFPISGLISFQMDDNQKFMSLKDQIRLGIVKDSVQRETTPSAGEQREDILYPQKRYFHKNLERENDINLVDLNVNAEKEFKLQVLDFLNSKTPKLFRSATEGNYYVYTMNSSLTPNDVVGRMLHTFNCTAYEIGPVQDFYDSLIGRDFEGLYNISGNPIPRTDLNKFYTKTLSILNTDNQINYNLLMDNELARNFYIRDADPLSNYTISFIDKNDTNRIIEDQIITIGATGSYNYFCVEPSVYIKGVWIGRLNEDGERINVSKYTGITFRNIIRIPLSDFDFISGTSDEDCLAVQLSKPDRDKILQYYYQVLNGLKEAINIADQKDYSNILSSLLDVKENFRRIWNQDDYGANIVSQIIYGRDIEFSNSLRTLSSDVYSVKDTDVEYYEKVIDLIELIRMDGDFILELTPVSDEEQTALISNIYDYTNSEKTIVSLDKILLLRARNFNERYAEQAVFSLDNYYSIIQELEYLEKYNLGDNIYISKELDNFLETNSFVGYIINKIALSAEQRNEYDNNNLRNHKEFSFNVSYVGKKNNSFAKPLEKAKELQAQNKQVILVPPSTTKILAIEVENPGNFYYYGTTGDNIYYDISCQMGKTTYQFEL